MFAPFEELVAEGHQVFNVGADVLALGTYAKQRLELVSTSIDALPDKLKPTDRTPYG
jgi:hypothetical protein